jgi:hypothetical protein
MLTIRCSQRGAVFKVKFYEFSEVFIKMAVFALPFQRRLSVARSVQRKGERS